MLRDEIHHVVLTVLVRPSHSRSLHTVIIEELGGACRGVDGVALLGQLLGRLKQTYLTLGTTRRDEHGILRNRITRGNQRVEHSLVEVIAQTAYLTRRAHIHTQNGIGILQTCERELRGLHTDAIDIELALFGLLIRCIEHDLRGSLDEVALQDLRYEGERTGCTEVALDDLHFAVLGQELDIERTADVQFGSDLMSNLLDLTDGGEINVLCGEYHRGIARVHTGILNVLRDGILDHLSLIGHGIELNLLRFGHELRYHHGELLRNLGSHIEETMQLLFIVADVHGSA